MADDPLAKLGEMAQAAASAPKNWEEACGTIRGALDEAKGEIHRKSGLEANFVDEGRLVAFCVGRAGEVPGLIFRLKEDRSGVEVVYGTIRFEGADITGREKALEATWRFDQVTRDTVLEAVVSWAEAEFEAP